MNAGPQSAKDKATKIVEVTGTGLSQADVEALLALAPGARDTLQKSAEEIAGIVMAERVTPDKLDEAREKARAIASNPPLSDPVLQRLLTQVSTDYIAPNTVLDKVQTDRRKKAARDAVNEVITTRLQGEVVVSKGELVTEEQVELLKTLGFTRSPSLP